MGKEWDQGQGTWMGPEASWAGKEPISSHPGKTPGSHRGRRLGWIEVETAIRGDPWGSRLQDLGLSLFSSALSRTPNIHFYGFLDSGHPKNVTCMEPWACERGAPLPFYWIWVTLTFLDSRTFNSSVGHPHTRAPGRQPHLWSGLPWS